MNPKHESLLLAGTEAFVLLICLGAIIWTVSSGMIFDIDGLLLVAVSLSLAGVFAFALLLHAKGAGWLDKLPLPGRKKAAAAEKLPAGDVK
jgi:hypothetical protein